VKNGMTGVNMQRRTGQGMFWTDPAKDIGAVIQWVRQNITAYNGNPERIFIWAHAEGVDPVAIYIGHPELHAPGGVGLKGAIMMSATFSIFPLIPLTGWRSSGGLDLQGIAKAAANDTAIPFGPLGPAAADAGRLVAQSNLRGFVKATTPFLFAVGEFDTKGPEFQNAMKDLLCAENRCPFVTVFRITIRCRWCSRPTRRMNPSRPPFFVGCKGSNN
jgi:hypothetical protein